MRKWRKRLASILAAAMLVSLLPVSALAGYVPGEGPSDEVIYNLGALDVTVGTDEEKLQTSSSPYALFDENGNYTLQLEPDAFFPYEVQFTCGGETWSEWFMDADDTVEVGGHVFSVASSVSDPETLTGLSFEIGGQSVIAWPEEKEFTNEVFSIAPMSLLPLEEYKLTVNLEGMTPPELMMPVDVKAALSGEGTLTEDDLADMAILCKSQFDDSYELLGDNEFYLQLNSYSSSFQVEFIVGTANQLDQTNKRYIVTFKYTGFEDWLTFSVLDEDGQEIVTDETGEFNRSYYTSSYQTAPEYILNIPTRYDYTYKLRLSLNDSLYTALNFDDVQVTFDDIVGGYDGTDITDELWGDSAAGFSMQELGYGTTTITMTKDGKKVGSLHMGVSIDDPDEYLLTSPDGGRAYYGYRSHSVDGKEVISFSVRSDYVTGEDWKFSINPDEKRVPPYVVKAVEGYYEDYNDPAVEALPDIKETLYLDSYTADYFNDEVCFTIFTENVGGEIVAEPFRVMADVYISQQIETANVQFYGIEEVNNGEVYPVKREHDTYVQDGFQTLLTTEDVDLSHLKLRFSSGEDTVLYYENDVQENYITTELDFSNGPVMFTAIKGDTGVTNYWVTVEKKQTGSGKLFINGANDPENPPVMSDEGYPIYERQVFLDGYYGDSHDIFLANLGDAPLTDLHVAWEQNTTGTGDDVLALDDYWTLTDGSSMEAFTSAAMDRDAPNGELSNAAKLRITTAQYDYSGELDSVLKIYSGTDTLAAIHITGVAGDPAIKTETIPEAVQYVPYSAVIQNTNRYEWNQVSYSKSWGELPEGMEMRRNGELYGVPKESGTFEFGVVLENSYSGFSDSYQSYTLVVNLPTDAAVEGQNDMGYAILDRVQDMTSYTEQVFRSEGEFDTFEDFYLDGNKLREGQDYDVDEGSTKITIRAQTFQNAGTGTHTIAAEFRTTEENSANSTLRRTAQNYTVNTNPGGNQNSSVSGGSGSSDSDVYEVNTPSRIDHGTVTVKPEWAERGDKVTITTQPDAGYELGKLTVKDKKGNAVALTNLGGGKYTFVMPASQVDIQAVFERIPSPIDEFIDVSANAYYAQAVIWALENGITSGTSAVTFGPDLSCTRAQIVTFLWREAGSPAPKSTENPFEDLSSDAYYYQAMLWAVENGITGGTTATTCEPNMPCPRAQAITLLWRAAGSPMVNGNSDFLDVPADAYYASAVAWAERNGITSGIGNGAFGVNDICSRAQIITFLYRNAQLG